MKQPNRIFFVVAALVVMFAVGSTGWAQEGRGNGRLTGIVYDSDKNPIEGVKVTLEYRTYTNQLERLSISTDQMSQW